MQDEIKSKVQDVFAANAEKYVASETHAKSDDLSLLVEWMKPSSTWTVLDIATGGGHVSKALSPHVAQVVACDLTQPMLDAARKHLDPTCNNVLYVAADAEALPFLDQSFDAVTCRIAAHHFPNPANFVKEVSRVLKPGGKFLLIDNVAADKPAFDQFVNTMEKLRDDSHFRCHTVQQWQKWLSDYSLQKTQSRMRKKTYPFPTWVRRTTESEEQVKQVEQHILTASEDILTYYAADIRGDEILSLKVDEWMVLAEKA